MDTHDMPRERPVTIHQDNNPKMFCDVDALGERNRGGANILYRLTSRHEDGGEFSLKLRFQDGHPQDRINGIIDPALLAVLIDRAQGFKDGPFPPNEHAERALYHLTKALEAMDARANDRTKRGVINTDKP